MSGRIKNTVHRTEVYCGLIALVVVGVMVLGFGSALWAQQAPAAPPTAEAEPTPPTPPAPPVFERVGQVTGTVVNVRGGPGIGYGALTKVLRGSRVIILSDREGWLKIVLPENDYSWVSAQFVEKGVGDVGTITGDAVNVRFDPAASGEVLGQLNRGFQLRIVEERQGWYRIKPLPGAIGWISSDFVKELPPEAVVIPTISTEQARKQWDEAEALYKAEVAKPDIAAWDLKKFVALYTALAKGAADRDVRFMAENRLEQLAFYQTLQDRLAWDKKHRAQVEQKLKDLEESYRRQIKQLREATRQPRYLATGVLKRLAISFLPPATHKIEGEDRILFLLYSSHIDLATYQGKQVGLMGTMTVPKGWETPLIRVTGVRILKP